MIPLLSLLLALATSFAGAAAPLPATTPVTGPVMGLDPLHGPVPDTLEAPSLDRIVSLPNLAGTAPSAPTWSPDGRRVAFLWNDHGMPFRDVWVVGVDEEAPRRLTWLAPAPETVLGTGDDTSLEALARRAAAREARGVSQVVWSPGGEEIFYALGGRVHRVPAPSGHGESVAARRAPSSGDPGPAGREHPVLLEGAASLAISPDGRHLAFLRQGDLWTATLGTGGAASPPEARRLTHLGAPGIGTVPWGAYLQPDAYVASFAWAPDSRALAFQYVDQRDVRRVPFPSYLPNAENPEPFLHEVRRPYPGDTALVRRIGIMELDNEAPRFLPLEAPHRRVIHEFAWSPDGSSLLVLQGADVAEDRWIFRASRQGDEVVELFHDHRPRRIYAPFRGTWSADGRQVIFLGDQASWYRLHALDADGGAAAAPLPLTLTGDYDVAGARGAPWLAVRGPHLFFQAAADSPYERHVYRLDLEGGSTSGAEPVRLTHLPGIHEPSLSPDGRWLALVTSSDTLPSELFLLPVEASGQARERRITHSPLPEFHRYRWQTPRYVSFPSRIDDFTIHARILEPPTLEPGKRYPVILGSIYSNTVQRFWNPDRPTSILQQQMAMSGDYITVLVDVRGSIGYGVDFREAFQGDWGGEDLEDLHSAVEYLAGLPHVDPDRIGIWGNSYGGLLVLAALFRKPGLFAAGVAGAPAVDVFHFTGGDQHLTRYPWTHPEIFERSLLAWGEELRDPLLMIHGVHDDIVPLKTTLMMAEKLTLLRRPFELELVHNSAHWWAASEHYALHTFRRLDDFLRRHVPPGGR